MEQELVIAFEKQYVTKALEGFKSTNLTSFAYRSLHEVGTQVFVAALATCLIDINARDFDTTDPGKQFDDLISFAGTSFDPKSWVIAYDGNDLVGMVLPQAYHDSPGEGSLFFLGIVPAYRGRGFGRALHAKGLELLAQMGLKKYIGSTDVINTKMINVFRSNACDFYKIRLFNSAGDPIGWKE